MTEATGDFRIIALREWGYDLGEAMPCLTCSRMGSWQLHHLNYKSRGGDNSPENLGPFCRQDHDALHAELMQVDVQFERDYRFIVTLADGAEIAKTPWPPVRHYRELIGTIVDTLRDQLEQMELVTPYLIAPELTMAAMGINQQHGRIERAMAQIAYERLRRTPRGQRTRASKDISEEWSAAGFVVSDGLVRNFAKRWLIIKELPDDLWDDVPRSVQQLAGDKVHSLDDPQVGNGVSVIQEWHDRPDINGEGERQSVRAFIAQTRAQRTEVCLTCGGVGKVLCPNCHGSGEPQ